MHMGFGGRANVVKIAARREPLVRRSRRCVPCYPCEAQGQRETHASLRLACTSHEEQGTRLTRTFNKLGSQLILNEFTSYPIKKGGERGCVPSPITTAKEEIPNLRSRVKAISSYDGVMTISLPVTVEALW